MEMKLVDTQQPSGVTIDGLNVQEKLRYSKISSILSGLNGMKIVDPEHRAKRARTILVTGAAGFIGSHLTERLLSTGNYVVGLDNFNRYYSPKRKRANLKYAKKSSHFYLVDGDIRDDHLLSSVFEKYRFETVVHLAAMAGVRPSIENPKLYADVNVVGTINLLEHMKQAGTEQLVFASSSSVYGNRKRGPFRETDATDEQISPYGASKKAGELMCHTYAHLYGIQTTCLRFFTAFGARNRPDMACYTFIHALMHDKPIMRFGDGKTGRDYTYIDDIVAGVMAAITNPYAFEIINLGNSQPVKLNELISQMEKVTGKEAMINPLPLQAGDVELTYADIRKAKKLLGWEPTTDLATGLVRLLDWYKQI